MNKKTRTFLIASVILLIIALWFFLFSDPSINAPQIDPPQVEDLLSKPLSKENEQQHLSLTIPLKCSIGQDCFVQHYIDMDPSKGASDYTCGSLTYDNHRGTDIRVKTLADMERGVAVIAAADGRVSNMRNGIADQYYSDYSKKKKKEIYQIGLGNVVIVSHGKGWETYYAHLKNGSLLVSKGQIVKKGDILGYVGMSGLTDFPHVHFELRYKNKRIDPFTGLKKGSECGNVQQSYWSKEAVAKLSYSPTAFIATGFSEMRPHNRKDLESGRKAQMELNVSAPTLFFWSYYIGSRKGDIITLKIMGPDGRIIAENRGQSMTKSQISRYLFAGKKRPNGGWKPGLYRGEITIERNGKILKDSAIISVN